jgi:predicted TIM-barrel fold metal-dependent hydrolase
MTLDANAWLGHYPFRSVPNNTPEGLLRLMDKHGIEKAVVSSLQAVFYRDAHPGNEELARWVAPHRDRLIPCATLNPTYAGWERDLRQCCEEWGMRGLRLFPSHHNYPLTAPECLELVRAASGRGLHVAIPQRLEDRRQRHWMDTTAEVTLTDVAALARACPETEIVVLEALGVESSPFVRDPSLAEARVSFEFSRMATVLQRSIPRLIEVLGPERLVFGTGMPLKYAKAALLKLELLAAPTAVKEQLARGNMERLLGIGV